MVTDDDTTLSEKLLMAADRISWAGLVRFRAGAWYGAGPVCLIGSLWAVRGWMAAGEEVGVIHDLLLEAAARAMEQGR